MLLPLDPDDFDDKLDDKLDKELDGTLAASRAPPLSSDMRAFPSASVWGKGSGGRAFDVVVGQVKSSSYSPQEDLE